MKLRGDFFHVQRSSHGYKGIVFQGSNVVDEIYGDTEEEVRALVKSEYPEAMTPEQEHDAWMNQYNSPEGRRWRRLNGQKP